MTVFTVTDISKKQQSSQRADQEPVFNEFRSEALVLMMRIFPLAMVPPECSHGLGG